MVHCVIVKLLGYRRWLRDANEGVFGSTRRSKPTNGGVFGSATVYRSIQALPKSIRATEEEWLVQAQIRS